MINLLEEIEKVKTAGYNEANAEARLCQDIILCGIANSSLNQNVTIKGGIVMRSLSKDSRRATQDIDLDFLRYSISDDAIRKFIGRIQPVEGITLELMEPIVELKHQDYNGKRVFIKICDAFEHELDRQKLQQCMQRYVYEDNTLAVNNVQEVIVRMTSVLSDKRYLQSVKHSKKNWTDLTEEEIFAADLDLICLLPE